MQNVCQQIGIDVNSAMMVVFGRMKAGEIRTKSGNRLKNIEFLDPIVDGDEMIVKIVAEVE